MARATRDGDRLYRYGGDEFAAILPGADRVVAHEVAERIRRGGRSRPSAPDRRPARRRSASASPASRRTAATKDELVEVADRALYLAKPDGSRDGRPRVTADPYLRALDETALALLDRHDPTACSRRS